MVLNCIKGIGLGLQESRNEVGAGFSSLIIEQNQVQ